MILELDLRVRHFDGGMCGTEREHFFVVCGCAACTCAQLTTDRHWIGKTWSTNTPCALESDGGAGRARMQNAGHHASDMMPVAGGGACPCAVWGRCLGNTDKNTNTNDSEQTGTAASRLGAVSATNHLLILISWVI